MFLVPPLFMVLILRQSHKNLYIERHKLKKQKKSQINLQALWFLPFSIYHVITK